MTRSRPGGLEPHHQRPAAAETGGLPRADTEAACSVLSDGLSTERSAMIFACLCRLSRRREPNDQEDAMSANTTRANKIATVIIPVADQDGAVEFYVGKLGFETRVDIPFGNGYRWVEVGLGSEATTIALAPPPNEGASGKRETGISLQTDDID